MSLRVSIEPMYREATKKARHFTLPVVTMSKTTDGVCGAGIAAAIIVNRDGWFITAAHVGQSMSELSQLVDEHQQHQQKVDEINGRDDLTPSRRRRELKKLGKCRSKVSHWSVAWGGTGAIASGVQPLRGVDLAVGRLEGVDFSGVQELPVFKSQTSDDEVGASVCRLGFPFNQIETAWNDQDQTFDFPRGLFPVPIFVNDGVISRFVNYVIDDADSEKEYLHFETSSPGLKGQSGGPIYDKEGIVWGLQSSTSHYDLEFSPESNGRTEHQFLNVGLAVDSSTISRFLTELGVEHATK